MKTYTFTPSSVASYLKVSTEETTYDCFFMSTETGVVVGLRQTPLANTDLPLPVRAEINRWFGTAFSLPHEEWKQPGPSPRAQFVDDAVPWEIDGSCPPDE